MSDRPRLAVLAPFLLVFLLAPLFAACGGDEETEPVTRPVRYTRVVSAGAERVRRFAGVASAGVESRLSFRVPGIVERVAVAVGDSVQEGQAIAELDAQDYRIELQRAEASLRQAQAEQRNAESNYERMRGLWENDNASLSDLQNAQAGYESALAAVQSLQNQVRLASLQLSYTRLTAPMAGAIARVPVEVNENVAAGQEVALLTSGAAPQVELAIPEVLIAGVSHGARVEVTFDAIPGRSFAGRVTEVGVAATDISTAFPVTVRLEEGDPAIRSGMAAEVAFSFIAGRAADRIEVPPVAVGEDQDGRFVFVVEPEQAGFGVVHRRQVSIGELTTQGLEVLDGLADGDLVVTAGVSQLEEGTRVRLLPETP